MTSGIKNAILYVEEFLDVDPALALVHGRRVAGSLENDRTANDRAQPDAHDHGYGGHRPFIRIIHYRVRFHGDQDAAEEERPCSPHAPTQTPALSAKHFDSGRPTARRDFASRERFLQYKNRNLLRLRFIFF